MRHPTRVGHDCLTPQGGLIPTHYEVLGLPRDASSVDIAHAFREKLAAAREGPDADQRVEAVRDAYQVLAAPAYRARYDADLPPDPRPAMARENRAGGLAGILRQPGALKVLAAVAALFLAIVLYKAWFRPAPASPPAVATPRARKLVEPSADERAMAAARAQREMQSALARPMTPGEIFAAASRSVARIVVTDDSGTSSQGSGVVIGAGTVVTSCHVMRKSPQVRVMVGDREYEGNIRVADYELDLCKLSVTGLGAPAATMAPIEAKAGQQVYAIAAPQGPELTLSEGLVSALRESPYGPIIQTTAAVSPGSSGGGLFDASGHLVGIVTVPAKGGQDSSFVLPAGWLLEMVDRPHSHGTSPVR
ncbi:MAG TPA: trypsin-like peptidase domain-containing protein [Usitatibacter sp.]|nr:trypsin-like peptidase domain-containing protein [Usitatibacter sp.]